MNARHVLCPLILAAVIGTAGIGRADDLGAAREPMPVFEVVGPVLPESASPTARMAEGRTLPLIDTFKDAEAWRAYKARFITATGRVVDTANHGISHSEGQGYGMLLAVAADDRAAFDAIWGWTRANLMVRDDELLAWRWEPDERPAVADMNDASDGDILVAWALTEAAEAWDSLPYRTAARRIAVEVGRKLILPHTDHGALLLPGVAGFAAEDRPDGPVVNLSYWVFPAFARLPLVAPEVDWSGLSRNGLDLVARVKSGAAGLPTDWTSLHDVTPRPADGFQPLFAYNAIRIPLYLAWAGLGRRETYAPFVAIWRGRDKGLPIIDVATGRPNGWLTEKGYAAVAALTACAADGTPLPHESRHVDVAGSYYSVTLDMLSLVAARMRYASCIAG